MSSQSCSEFFSKKVYELISFVEGTKIRLVVEGFVSIIIFKLGNWLLVRKLTLFDNKVNIIVF